MAPATKLRNEQLLDLARSLRQERLLIGSERQNLQTLNQKVQNQLLRTEKKLFNSKTWQLAEAIVEFGLYIVSLVKSSQVNSLKKFFLLWDFWLKLFIVLANVLL